MGWITSWYSNPTGGWQVRRNSPSGLDWTPTLTLPGATLSDSRESGALPEHGWGIHAEHPLKIPLPRTWSLHQSGQSHPSRMFRLLFLLSLASAYETSLLFTLLKTLLKYNSDLDHPRAPACPLTSAWGPRLSVPTSSLPSDVVPIIHVLLQMTSLPWLCGTATLSWLQSTPLIHSALVLSSLVPSRVHCSVSHPLSLARVHWAWAFCLYCKLSLGCILTYTQLYHEGLG